MFVAYNAMFFAAIIALAFCIYLSIKSEKSYAKDIRQMAGFALMTIVFSQFALQSGNVHNATMLYTVTFISMNGVVAGLFAFVCDYTQCKKRARKVYIFVMAVLAIDTLAFVISLFHPFMLSVKKMYMHGHSVIGMTTTDYFWFYWLSCGFISFICVCILVSRAVRVPTIYRIQYYNTCIGLIVTILLSLGFVRGEQSMDIALMAAAISILVTTYYTLFASPKKYVQKAHELLMDEMHEAVLLFDYKLDLLDLNDKALKFFGITNEDFSMQEIEDLCKSVIKEHKIPINHQFDKKVVFEVLNDKRICRVHCEIVRDKHYDFVGSYLMIEDVTEIEKKQDEAWYKATHDELTDTYTRSMFFEKVSNVLSEDTGEEYLIICSDIYGFKMINENFGTLMGDTVLKSFARNCTKALRKDEFLGRLGNDIFCAFIKKDTFDGEELLDFMENTNFLPKGSNYPIHVYFGIYEIRSKELNASQMTERALMAMKKVKGDPRQRICYYDESIRAELLEEQVLLEEVDQAFENEEFEIFLQPQVNSMGQMCGAEALVRWRHPIRDLVPPIKFIPPMEENGVIARLDAYVWEKACAQLAKWKQQGREDIYLSINISPKDFYLLDVYETITSLVEKYDINPANLKLEITESAMMQNVHEQLILLKRLKKYGFVVEMDDFGSGYSSLNMLKDIDVDVLKIDMAFLDKGIADDRSRRILHIMIDLARTLNTPSIIEGVETAEQFEFLANLGCDLFQGYYFAKPMEIAEFEKTYMMAGA